MIQNSSGYKIAFPGIGIALLLILAQAGAACKVAGDYCATGDVHCSPASVLLYQVRTDSSCKTLVNGVGTGSAAQFNTLRTVITDGTGLFVADAFNNRIRKVELSSGAATTLAGDGTAAHLDGIGTGAHFNFSSGLALHENALFVGDSSNHVIRKIDLSTGQTSTPAGMVGGSGSGDGTGTAAQFNSLSELTVLGGDLYVCDEVNHTIRKVSLDTLEVTTVAGLAAGEGGGSGYMDGTGSVARFTNPWGIATDGTYLYVADFGNHRIRRIE